MQERDMNWIIYKALSWFPLSNLSENVVLRGTDNNWSWNYAKDKLYLPNWELRKAATSSFPTIEFKVFIEFQTS